MSNIDYSHQADATAYAIFNRMTRKKMTNADKIRAMSDEDLAEMLCSTDGDFPPNCEDVPVRKLEEYWLEWLKQEATP